MKPQIIILLFLISAGYLTYLIQTPDSTDFIPFYPQKGYLQAKWDKKLFDATFEACQKSYRESMGAKNQLVGAVAYRGKKRYTVQINNEKLTCVEAYVYFNTNATYSEIIEFYVKMLEKGNSYEPFLISNKGRTSLPADYRSKYEKRFRN